MDLPVILTLKYFIGKITNFQKKYGAERPSVSL